MDKKPKVLGVLPGLIPSTILGIVKPLLEMDRRGTIDFKITLTRTWKPRQIRHADIIVFCRNCEAEDFKILAYAKKLNKKIIFEVDDNFFEMSTDNVLGEYHRHPLRLFTLQSFMKSADLCRVYSNPLVERANYLNAHVQQVKAYFDFNLLKGVRQRSDNVIKIVYATSRSVDNLGEIFSGALNRILKKYKGKVEICIWGTVPENLRGQEGVRELPFIRDYNKFVRFFYEMNFDIGLAPTKDDIFHRSKTNNKFREYAACRVAGIYSNVDIYSDCITNGETGLLVENNEEEWFQALDRLIVDEVLRNNIKCNALNYVMENFSFESAVLEWQHTINQLLQSERRNVNGHLFDISKLSILILFDRRDENRLINRIRNVSETAHYFGAHIEYVPLEDVHKISKKIIKCYDTVFVFVKSFNDLKNVDFDCIKQIRLVIDFIYPPNREEGAVLDALINNPYPTELTSLEYPNHDRVNNIVSFPFHFDEKEAHQLETLFRGIYGVSILSMLEEMGSKYVLDLIENILRTNRSNKMLYFSEESPLFYWAEWLSKQEGRGYRQRKKPAFVVRWTSGIKRKYHRIYSFTQKASTTLWLLFRINTLKRYK